MQAENKEKKPESSHSKLCGVFHNTLLLKRFIDIHNISVYNILTSPCLIVALSRLELEDIVTFIFGMCDFFSRIL